MRLRLVRNASVRTIGGATAPMLEVVVDMDCGHSWKRGPCPADGVSMATFEALVKMGWPGVAMACFDCPDEEVAPEAPAAVGVRPAVADPLGALPKKPGGYKL